MTTVDWEEVKRLAADFQKAQLSSTLLKLSERNCVEIVSKLVENKLVDIIFTNDGKEYVTPQYLGKEIKDELYVHGGRVSLVDLAQILNVSLSHVTKVAAEIEKHNKGIRVVLGQLIDRSYMVKVAEEINDKLMLQGCINVAELTLSYDLPAEYLQSLVEKELGKTVFGKQDSQDSSVFYTESFIARNKAKIRGALSAVTKPTPLSAILGQCSVPERIFFTILDNLQETKQIPGSVSGKQGTNGLYVPTIYSKSQNEWIENFYKQNGFLEYDSLHRLGISDPLSFIKRHFPKEDLIFLNSVAVSSFIIDQVDAEIEEAVNTGSHANLDYLMPYGLTDDDKETIVKLAEKKANRNTHIFAGTVVVSDAYLQKVSKPLEVMAESKARESLASGKWLQSVADSRIKSKSHDMIIENKMSKKEERRKKASSGKAGGGSQGRETKTKSTKKKYLQGKGRDNDSDDEVAKPTPGKLELSLVTVDDVRETLDNDDNVSVDGDLLEDISWHLQPKINKYALTTAEQLAQSSKTTNLSEIEERTNVLLTNIKIFDKGIRQLDKDDQVNLTKYLLKSIATDVVTDLFKLAAQQNMLQIPENMTIESRQKLLLNFPPDVREPLTNIHKALQGSSVEEFLNFADAALAACCLALKKYDKKKERPFVVGHREALIEELNVTEDPALALHLITSILFTAATQNALYMSGRHVSSVLAFLTPLLQPDTVSILSKYHDLVLRSLASTKGSKEDTINELKEHLAEIKSIAGDLKRHLKGDNKEQV